MKKLFNPISLLLTVTLPGILLFAILGKLFYIIYTELSSDEIVCWIAFAAALFILCLSFTVYSLFAWRRMQIIWTHIAFPMFIFYLAFVIVFCFQYSNLIPRNISNYMLMGISPVSVLLTLVMPTLLHSVMLITVYIIAKFQLTSIIKSFLCMIAIPVFWYILINFIGFDSIFYAIDIWEYVVLFMFLVSIVVFLFLFLVVMYMTIAKYKEKCTKYMAIVALGASLGGLILNSAFHNVFGDFSHWLFFVADILVIGILLLPKLSNKWWRLGIFGLKVCSLWYSIYFFIVFLPYMPFALPGTLIFGLGLLLLAPTLLIFVHINDLKRDYEFLMQFFNKKRMWIFMSLAFSVIPLCTGVFLYNEKINLDNALRYVYQRSYEGDEKLTVHVGGVKRVLQDNGMLILGRRNAEDIFWQDDIPYLSSLYQYVVMDGLSLAPQKVEALEKIYLGEYEEPEIIETTEEVEGIEGIEDIDTVRIKDVTTQTLFDEEENVYKSWIHFELESMSFWGTEFYTIFELPQGSYISDYYLYVEDEKRYGMIADKRAANWIYEQNKIINRDPGVLTDLGDNKIEFKVFPFDEGEVRKTGIEIIHNRPIELIIEGETISLRIRDIREGGQSQVNLDIHPSLHYITKEIKDNLSQTTRTPEYYFIMDLSKGNEENREEYINRINSYIEKQGIEKDVKEIIGVNYEEKRLGYQGKWQDRIKKLKVKGGFYPEYTMYQILYEHYKNPSDKRPVFILVTDQIERAVFAKDMSELAFISPEGIRYYHLNKNRELIEYSDEILPSLQKGRKVLLIPDIPVLAWKSVDGKTYYVPDDKEDTLILTEGDIDLDKLDAFTWESAVLLEALYRSYLLQPEKYTQKTYDIVQLSISSHIMSPLTSFIVLENETQEKVMLEKQKQLLESEKSIEIQDITEMEEPPFYIIAFMMIVYVGVKSKKNIKIKDTNILHKNIMQ